MSLPLLSWVFWHIDSPGGPVPLAGCLVAVLDEASPVTSKTLQAAGVDPDLYDTSLRDPGLDVARPGHPRYVVSLPNPVPGGKPYLMVPDPLKLSALAGGSAPPAGTCPLEDLAVGKSLSLKSNGTPESTRVRCGDKVLHRVRNISFTQEPGGVPTLRIEALTPTLEIQGVIATLEPYTPEA